MATVNTVNNITNNLQGLILNTPDNIKSNIKKFPNNVSCYPWGNYNNTGKMPVDAILHWDADINSYKELVEGSHLFQYNVLSPQYQRNADGSYSNVGAKPAVDVFDGERWLRSCGAVTNMLANSVFAGAVSGAPGTAPTGWAQYQQAGASVVVGGEDDVIALAPAATAPKTMLTDASSLSP